MIPWPAPGSETVATFVATSFIWGMRVAALAFSPVFPDLRVSGIIGGMTSRRRFGPLVAFLFAFVLVLEAQTGTERSAPIIAALRAKDFEAAVRLSREALAKSPSDPQLWTLQGIGLSADKHNPEALAAFHHALRISPDYLPALEGAAQIAYEAGDKEAEPLLRRIVRLQPGEQTSHAMLGALASKEGNCPQAVGDFEQSGPLLESQPAAMKQYGVCLIAVKQTAKGVSVFQKLVESHPEDARARRDLAALELKVGKPQEALTTLKPLLVSAPDTGAMQLAAAAYEANGETPAAVKLLRDAIVEDPRNVALYVDFANIAFSHQSFRTGIEMINTGINLQPNAAPLYLARGVLYVQLADFDRAEADFEKAEELDPHQSISAAAQGMAVEEQNQNDPDRALAVVKAKLAKRPDDAFLLYLQAAILAQKAPATGSPEFLQAMRSAKKAVALQNSLVRAHDVLAKLYLQSGQTEASISECQEALRHDPKDQTALYHLIVGLRKADRKAEIPDLLKRLAAARQDATKVEAEQNRYKLVVDSGAQSN
jgi:tetratricopeptide (TPR) repeat protein